MNIQLNDPPRTFSVNDGSKVLSDMGKVELETSEQVTFCWNASEYDVAKTKWGYYATPSINHRLSSFGFKTALVKNPQKRIYVLLVHQEHLSDFDEYLRENQSEVLLWLDDAEQVIKLLKNSSDE